MKEVNGTVSNSNNQHDDPKIPLCVSRVPAEACAQPLILSNLLYLFNHEGLVFIFGVLALLSIIPPARSSSFNIRCHGKYYHCKLKCDADEYAMRYCPDNNICCRVKKTKFVGQTKW
ncbi:beta-defensin 131B [Cebus imitator]|uniref:beta-defensin 131B n=1 Tax=Cebus imitator TaxID=2715852 RepID=UPI00189806A7|nr:beta-defensin 131B [Cebus imitator]